MLEFKNVVMAEGMSPLSFVVRTGEILAVKGAEGSGKTMLVNVVLGRLPVYKGYVTIDGELVTAGSAPYFRKMMGYVPQNVDFPLKKVSDIVNAMIEISASRGRACTRKDVVDEMSALGVAEAFLDVDTDTADKVMLKIALMAVCSAIGGRILVVDSPTDIVDVRISAALKTMAEKGWVVLVTERDDYIEYDKKVDLYSPHF